MIEAYTPYHKVSHVEISCLILTKHISINHCRYIFFELLIYCVGSKLCVFSFLQLWTTAIDFRNSEEEWMQGAIMKLDAQEIENNVEQW